MIDRFSEYIRNNNLFEKKDGIVVAVSGGVDSVVMLDLLVKSGFERVVVAHCNFNLRGAESDGDELLVRELADSYGLPVYVKRFKTAEYARKNRLSIQMAARQLRYEWFEELRQSLGYDYIAVAHNKNDSVETMLYNLSRGTGLYGLAGIKSQNGKVVRPLLFARRDEIENYAREHQLVFREDSSNRSVKYKRNYIRHRVIPELEKVSPNFMDAAYLTGENIRDYIGFFEFVIEKIASRYVKESPEGDLFIDKGLFGQFGNFSVLVLWHLLKRYGCNFDVCRGIVNFLNHTGASFFCGDYEINIGRNTVYVFKPYAGKDYFVINTPDALPDNLPFDFSIKIVEKTDDFTFENDKNMAYADAGKLKFPLVLRRWRHGDVFVPFGMKKTKKLSDFFTDLKLDKYYKNRQFVLEDASKKIVWVVGFRVSEEFKVEKKTTSVVMFSI